MGCAASVGREDANEPFDYNEDEDWNASYKLAHDHSEQERRANILDERAKSRGMRRDGSGKSFATKLKVDSSNAITMINDYAVKKALGKGNFGEVFLASDPQGTSYAIKVLKASALKKIRTGRQGSAFDTVKTEIATMKKIAHPNCVHMFDVIADGDDATTIFLVLEYVDGGVSQPNGKDGRPIPLAPRTIWSHMRHLLMGLEYLHTHDIIHRDIKPDNLLLTRSADATRRKGKGQRGMSRGPGVLKIADFGTSVFCDTSSANVQKTAGTPPFFSPELCTAGAGGSYDARAVDLWAVGVTVYHWACGRVPFEAPTVMLLMEAIKNAPEHVPAPAELLEAAKAEGGAAGKGGGVQGLADVIQGLLTKDPAKRLSLQQLRVHPWLTDGDAQPVPSQPVSKIELSEEEINQAVTNRAAIAYQSAAGPSALGIATGYRADWKREGLSTIRKKSTAAEANFYREIGKCGHLVHHVPVVYSIARQGRDLGDDSVLGAIAEQEDVAAEESVIIPEAVYEIRMQDLATGMTRPCAMAFVMGCRTATPADFNRGQEHAASESLTQAVAAIDPAAATPDGAPLTELDGLRYLDDRSSTSSLGFRIDAAKAMSESGELQSLVLPSGCPSLATLKEEEHLKTALGTFLHRNAAITKAAYLKLENMAAALERSAFFSRHCLLRSTLLLVYDDALLGSKQPTVELKMMNFGFSYALPDSTPDLTHDQPWDGSSDSHDDGYLLGVRNLVRLMKELHAELDAERPPLRGSASALARRGSSSKNILKRDASGKKLPASLQRI